MNNTAHLFNTDAALWASFFRAYPTTDLTYLDGAVYVKGECRAMFPDNKTAMATMTEARTLAGVK